MRLAEIFGLLLLGIPCLLVLGFVIALLKPFSRSNLEGRVDDFYPRPDEKPPLS
ncbi:MAG: hypothetical protein JWL87_716 [Candidatus Adlerbacteria bacterium]|nr:hypothetical protein [Candidatus Adlerbacteria bacterium]